MCLSRPTKKKDQGRFGSDLFQQTLSKRQRLLLDRHAFGRGHFRRQGDDRADQIRGVFDLFGPVAIQHASCPHPLHT